MQNYQCIFPSMQRPDKLIIEFAKSLNIEPQIFIYLVWTLDIGSSAEMSRSSEPASTVSSAVLSRSEKSLGVSCMEFKRSSEIMECYHFLCSINANKCTCIHYTTQCSYS